MQDKNLEQKWKEFFQVEVKFSNALENESTARRETESKFLRQVEDKISLVRSEMARENRNRQEGIENLTECLVSDI